MRNWTGSITDNTMSCQTPEFESPSKIARALERRYVGCDALDHEFDLGTVFRIDRSDEEWRRKRLHAIVDDLAELSPCAIAFDELRDTVDQRTESNVVPYSETVTAFAAALVDICLQYPAIERRGATRRLNESIRAGADGSLDAGRLHAAGSAIYELATTAVEGHELDAAVDAEQLAHPDDTAETLSNVVREHIESGEPTAVRELRSALVGDEGGVWTPSDLLRFEPIAFEKLLAELWSAYHNAARTTQASQDRGIDVIARTADGTRLLVQAKRLTPPNRVGITVVQRTAGLLVEFDADAAVVVTSSEFTESARTSGESMDDVHLVDGTTLCGWLTNSSLLPPLDAVAERTG